MTDKTSTRLIAVVLAVMTIGGIAVSGVAVAQESPGSDEDVDTQQSSHLRVIHAASDAPAVDVTVNNETVASNVEPGNASDYLELEAGNHTIQVTAASDAAGADTNETATDNESEEALFEGQINLEPRTSSTLALTADETQTGGMDEGAAETPTDDNETDIGADDNETDLGADDNETEDNETALGADDNETDLGADDNETEDNETELGADDNETELGADDNETTFGENETEDGGAAEAPTDDTQQVTSLSPVMYEDNAWEPDDGEAALSIIHLAPSADAVDVTVAGNESDAGGPTADDNASENDTTADNATVIAEDLEFQDASSYVTVSEGDHTLEIRQAAENNDGEVITTVNVTVEGGNAHSALVMAGDDATNQTTDGGAAETPTDDETTLGDNETEDNETDLGADDNETDLGADDNETDLGADDNETEDNETALGADDNETDLGADDNETEDNETDLGADDNETEDNETSLGDTTDGESQISLNVTTVQDVTYTVNLPGQDMADDGADGFGDNETEDNETDLGADDNETDLGADDNETDLGADDNETDFGADDNETEDNETDLGADDNETDFGADDNETDLGADDNETDLGDNETEDNETDDNDTPLVATPL